MISIFYYAVECNSLYKVVAFLIACTLFGFMLSLVYKVVLALIKLIQYITNKVTKYKEVHAKAQYKDASLEVDLNERDETGTE